jgi:predicted short-subunit dehydrogenase-like oxidoreductase (DUF2520 family)
MKTRVAIAGSGKVASAMALRMLECGKPADAVLARNLAVGSTLAQKAGTSFIGMEEIPSGTFFDIIILCVADDAIPAVARLLRPYAAHLLHVSGSATLAALGAGSNGVFYPLMTFPAGRTPDWHGVKVFTEASHPYLEVLFPELAFRLQVEALPADSYQRFRLHIAAVFANNFTVASFRAAQYLLEEAGQQRETLLPLMRATFELLLSEDANEIQTGPAQRGDKETLAAHIRALDSHPELQEMYAAISNFIDAKRGFDRFV